MPAIGAGIQAGAGIVQTAIGLINAGKAKREARELEKTRPKYEISPLAQDELSLSESELATGGLSSKSMAAYNNLNNQQFSSSLDAILKSGGSVNNIANVFGANEEGRTRLATLNDQLRLQKINNLINSRRYMTEQQDKAFQVNKYAPYMDKAVATGVARQRAEDMIWGGANAIGAAGVNYATQLNQNNQFNKYLNAGNKRTTSAADTWTPPPYRFGQYSEGGIYGDPNQTMMDQLPKWDG